MYGQDRKEEKVQEGGTKHIIGEKIEAPKYQKL